MELTVNGEPRQVTGPTALPDLLVQLGVRADRVAVELNRAVVPRAQHAQTMVKDGDVVEIVTFVGGG